MSNRNDYKPATGGFIDPGQEAEWIPGEAPALQVSEAHSSNDKARQAVICRQVLKAEFGIGQTHEQREHEEHKA